MFAAPLVICHREGRTRQNEVGVNFGAIKRLLNTLTVTYGNSLITVHMHTRGASGAVKTHVASVKDSWISTVISDDIVTL